jgi:NADPH:quinone reductase
MMMRGFTLDSFDAPPGLRDDLLEPRPAANQLVVRVLTSSVNGADAAVAAGMVREMAKHTFPVTLGRDFAGVVEDTGGGVSGYQRGDEVFGFLPLTDPTVHEGSWAELISVPEDNSVASKPATPDMAESGVAPLTGITALAALDALAPSAGESVLVIGAPGGVGSFFVQLAAGAGAHVVAPVLAEDHHYVRELGVAELLDRNGDVAAGVRERHPGGVDAILDVVSQTPDASLLKQGGRLASPLGAAGEGPGRFNVMAISTTANLQRLAPLIDSGELRVPIPHSYRLEQAGEALQALPATHTQGKLGVTIT